MIKLKLSSNYSEVQLHKHWISVVDVKHVGDAADETSVLRDAGHTSSQ